MMKNVSPNQSIIGRAPQGARGLKFMFSLINLRLFPSRPARGAWVEILLDDYDVEGKMSRPARGAWVEMISSFHLVPQNKSRPARGAWVEINIPVLAHNQYPCRAPQGARGLKYKNLWTPVTDGGRAPQGARGLKY